jgi:hypothetical protein
MALLRSGSVTFGRESTWIPTHLDGEFLQEGFLVLVIRVLFEDADKTFQTRTLPLLAPVRAVGEGEVQVDAA